MFKGKLIANVIVFSLLLSFAVNVSVFTVSRATAKGFSGVVYASTGVPVSGVMVIASGDNGYGTALTNLQGQYAITEGLKTGNYTVFIIKEGYLRAERDNVMVTAGYPTSGIDFNLILSGGISGRVTDAASSLGIPNIMVTAIPADGNSTYFWTALTDVIGNYRMATNLATGIYNVTTILPKGYVMGTRDGVSVTAGAYATGADLALERSGIISGRVTASPSGSPLPNATVITFSGGYYGVAQTNATGYYRIASGLGTGTYDVMATYPGVLIPVFVYGVSVVAGSETSHVDLNFTTSPPSASGTIMGTVKDASNNPIPGAHVTAQGGGAGSGNATTDGDGNYIVSSGLGTGTYTVTASAPGYQPQDQTSISVMVSQVTANINFQLAKIPVSQSGAISGTITGDPNALPEMQYPLMVLLAATLVVIILAKLNSKAQRFAKVQKGAFD